MKKRFFPVLLAVVGAIVSCAWGQVAARANNAAGDPQSAAVPEMPQPAVTPSAPRDAAQGAVPGAKPVADASTVPQVQQRYPRYKLTPGDILDINFAYWPEMNQEVTVQPDGFIALREIGGLRVQDLTTEAAGQAIEKSYSVFLKDPVVTVVLKDFAKPYFIVGGWVRNPGKFDLRQATTVAEAIQIAGGFTEASKHSEVWLYHRMPDDSFEGKRLNMKKMLAEANLKEDMRLESGDMVYVPQNAMSKFKAHLPSATASTMLKPY